MNFNPKSVFAINYLIALIGGFIFFGIGIWIIIDSLFFSDFWELTFFGLFVGGIGCLAMIGGYQNFKDRKKK